MRQGRLMISAAGSGCGKSVVTMGLLQALKERGLRIQSFKCGPDYIDPGFHGRVLGIPCRNLDTFLMGEKEVLDEVKRAGMPGLLSVAEGAMGLFDGLGGGISHSAYSIAALCRMPVIVVLDAGKQESCAHQLQLLLERDSEHQIRGVLINRCSREKYTDILPELKALAEVFRQTQKTEPDAQIEMSTDTRAGTPEDGISRNKSGRHISFCGFLPLMTEAEFESRHLGLTGAAEVEDFAGRLHRIAAALEKEGCIDSALAVMGSSDSALQDGKPQAEEALRTEDGQKAAEAPAVLTRPVPRCRIAVARDEAFLFLYQRSLENLERAGAELCFFSPLHDKALPENSDGLYLPGGYPELFAPYLEENRSMRQAVKEAILSGMPTVAECGGFLYLGEILCGEDGQPYKMAGALPGRAERKEKLVRFGYLELMQEYGDSLLFREGECVRAHEFHYWDSDHCGGDLLAVKRSKGLSWRCGYVSPTLYAAFPHLYLNQERAERFIAVCR